MELGQAEDLSNQRFGKLVAIERKENKGKIATWFCQCDCGGTKVVRSADLKRGRTKSCGCLYKTSQKLAGMKRRKSSGEAAFNSLYFDYGYAAKIRNLSFQLTKTQFRKLTKSNCAYCGISPNNIYTKKNANGDYIYNGIDRVNNNKGYELDNCVPCCKFCNYAKSKGTKKEFLDWIARLIS